MSIHKLKIFDFLAVKPLCLIFINCCLSGIFSVIWKMSNIVPIHKKSDKLKINMSLSASDKHAEPVDKCQIKANFKEPSLFWFFTNQMYCTLLPAPVCASFVAGSNSEVITGAGH